MSRNFMKNLTEEFKGWATDLMNKVTDVETIKVLKSISENPFKGFEEKYRLLGRILKSEGGMSPAAKRAVFIAHALDRYNVITMRELNSVYYIMSLCIMHDDSETEDFLRYHALELLVKTWERHEEIGSLLYQEKRRILQIE